MRATASSSVAVPIAASCCRLTTFTSTGREIDSYSRVGFGDGRIYVRLPASSPALGRIWNSARARVLPCTSGGRPIGPAVEARARVLADGEDAQARRALANGRERPGLPQHGDRLYVEIVPKAD